MQDIHASATAAEVNWKIQREKKQKMKYKHKNIQPKFQFMKIFYGLKLIDSKFTNLYNKWSEVLLYFTKNYITFIKIESF